MTNLRATFLLFASLLFACASPASACPDGCSCKWKSGKITAECSDRGLITVPSGIDVETQVLDISGNDLQNLHHDTFQRSSLINLQKLYMRSCRLGQIDKNAFRGLANLIEIDLSDNLLTHVPSQAFEDVPYLRNVSLARNPIQKVDAFAFRAVPQLGRLDLSHCNVQSVRPKAFDNLNALEYLKLNDNELQEVPADTLDSVRSLRTVELHGNRWKCDCYLRGIKVWIGESRIHVPYPLFCAGGPERLKDKSIAQLDADDFACKPTIKAGARHIEAPLASNVTLECSVESDPVATITWYFGDDRVLSNDSTYDDGQRLYIVETHADVYDKRSRLVLRHVGESDAGDYHCVVENRAGNDEANFTLYPTSQVARNGSNANLITVALVFLILFMLIVIALLVKKMRYTSYQDDDLKNAKAQPEKQHSPETSSQHSNSSAIKSELGNAFTVASDLSYSRSLSDIGNPTFSNPDLISGTNPYDSTCVTPIPITRPISDDYQDWQKSYTIPPGAVSSSGGFNYDAYDRLPMMVDMGGAGSASDEVVAHCRLPNDYPPDYGLPILPENGVVQPYAKTLKVWQRGVPVLPAACSGPPPPLHMTPPANQRYQRCGTDV